MVNKSRKAKAASSSASLGEGDLRRVPRLVDGWLEGDEAAASALMSLGRDAAHQVLALAEKRQNSSLSELGQRLIATPPQVETNLFALRSASVDSLLAKARTEASALGKGRTLMVEGGAVALFDPLRVRDNLARSGRPRRDPARVAAGDIAWVGLPEVSPSSVRLVAAPPPPLQNTLTLGLRVDSGVIFAGPPEASDGPRLGALLRDPFSTALDMELSRGQLLRLKADTYRLDVFSVGDTLFIHLRPDPSALPGQVDFESLGRPPGAHPSAGERS